MNERELALRPMHPCNTSHGFHRVWPEPGKRPVVVPVLVSKTNQKTLGGAFPLPFNPPTIYRSHASGESPDFYWVRYTQMYSLRIHKIISDTKNVNSFNLLIHSMLQDSIIPSPFYPTPLLKPLFSYSAPQVASKEKKRCSGDTPIGADFRPGRPQGDAPTIRRSSLASPSMVGAGLAPALVGRLTSAPMGDTPDPVRGLRPIPFR